MTDDYYKLTFSQREGKAQLPEAMTLEHIPQRFRQLAWLSVDNAIGDLITDFYDFDSNSYSSDGPIGSLPDGIPNIIRSYKFDIMLIPHDKISYPCPSEDREFSRKIILFGEYHDTITFIEHILRHKECTDSLYTSLVDAFDKASAAYFVEKVGSIPSVIPRISRESGEAIQRAIETISEGGMDGAATHLRQATEHINTGQHADAIADSIHAVESVARKIDPRSNKNLSHALDSLEQTGMLKHPGLKKALCALYGYTSDQPGIRHALVFQNAADVSLDEAIFMLGACASFAAYLTQKHRKAKGEISDGI